MLFNQDYVNNPAISQSDIGLFETDIRAYYNHKIQGVAMPQKKSNPMDIGSIIDAKILVPEELKNYYVVTDMKAAGKVKDVVEEFYKHCTAEQKETVADEPATMVLEPPIRKKLETALAVVNYQSNWLLETRIQKILTEGADYFKQLAEAADRYVIGLKQWNVAMSKVEEINNDEYTSAFFDTLFKENPGIIIHRQPELYGEFEDMKIKGRLDLLIENTNTMRMSPWDMKTSASHSRFQSSYRALRYGRQGAFYWELARQNFPGYQVDPFRFLVIPTESDEKPEQYEMDPSEMNINTFGYTYDSGYRVRGWQEIIREIKWHHSTGKWNHHKDYYTHGKNIINSKVIVEGDLMQAQQINLL